MKTEKIFVVRIAFAAAAFCSLGVSGEDKVVNASSFGWNAEDSTAALQAAFDSGASKVIIDRQAGDWISRPLVITNSNIEVVLADGVTLKAKRGEFYGRNDCLVRITGGISNIVLRGEGKAVLKMNKADYQNPKNKYSFSEWRHAVSILKAQNVTVKDLTILSSGGDGVYVNGAKDVTLENLVVRDHHRQGMSPISVDGMTVRRCCFNDTVGVPPQCGIDMEPNREDNRFVNVVYEDCVFNGNRSHGIDMHFGHFTARTEPVSIIYRRCKAYGNGGCGVSFMTGTPNRIEEFGQVKGFVRFENCEFAGNHGAVLNIRNHSTNGMDISFADCIFDARDSSGQSAIYFDNNRYLGDFGGLTFERCTVKLDKGRKVFGFLAQTGVGIGGKLSGDLAVECDGKLEKFDLAAFAAKHKPRPERIVRFKSTAVEFPKLKPMSAGCPVKGKFTPGVSRSFIYVVAVPGPGEYKVHFRSAKSKGNLAVDTVMVQLFDKSDTDLGSFQVPIGKFDYTLKASGANVYRFEVASPRGLMFRMACDGAAGALMADNLLRLRDAKGVDFHFCVPANAETVTAKISPEEPVQAILVDASGKTVAEMPYQRANEVFSVKRQKTLSNEVWALKFPRVDEDFAIQIGVDGVPLVSIDPDGVIGMK